MDRYQPRTPGEPTRHDYPKGSFGDCLERLMLGDNKINKVLIASVLRGLQETSEIEIVYPDIAKEIEAELEEISSSLKEEKILEEVREVEYLKRPDVVALIEKIKQGDYNIVRGYN